MDLKALEIMPPWEWPKGTGKELRKVLADGRADAADRLIAAELAGDFTVINDELAGQLLGIVRNSGEPEALRGQAAISFGAALETADTFEFEDPDEVPISEPVFHAIQETLQQIYRDESVPKLVRRRALEASVRASETWHADAIRTAYSSGDQEWRLTAVFAMRWVRGFDAQILESLHSADEEIHYEAVEAAGNWGIDAAWPHVAALVKSEATEKSLRLAAIGAVAGIRPAEAVEMLAELTGSDDEDIADAASDAMAMADESDDEFDKDEEDEEDGDWLQ
jgi:hypothetical protein